ncbi:5-carboxymethyl-2-hydroxymuconate Delta-isomerase [Legionella oakridgensis]|uniref:5-carboxymethyl-2-hydroxymuconate isomerase n=2 Tax=Legionella oakridgensis TaxID=29423 RepID=W0BCG5_9GAMM|nr:5-carboxymethyl-2-hydroxymuconate Delta-isomerase [Legionella oakridgensis]AHE67555.1 5-carboxymethyl-2-hydroxymuconate isomerase [Legionella oakridgensis ATCC 33761 = DSM 21215]ETO92801.1 5-carboxymethyl-2-hydroxymuconate isomerase [Legionella oakridgensis RV-2-2007]KTD37093.1 5-carboxymethyl-2-hydroxymuconate Delta-isomerase [Legionella oakridgensis]STY20598.1 5-carboxymethyl-2-hydroxymuconate Delta-isomerase [Legionella longbeachae]
MPHLILECSNNIASTIDFKPLFQTLHQLLADKLPTQITSCKSRVVIHDHYFIGNDFEHGAFIHLTIKILPGRTNELKSELAKQILDIINTNISQHHLNTATSVEILDLSPQYFKK